MPSPVGLVVKKGLNIFSFTSVTIPVPLLRILISTRSPRFAGCYEKRRLVTFVGGRRLTFDRRMKSIRNDVEKGPRDFLGIQVRFARFWIE